MPSVGFQSSLPSVADFLANQGAFIDAQILNIVVGSAIAESASSAVAGQAARLNGFAARQGAAAKTQAELAGLSQKIAQPEIDKIDQHDAGWAARQAQRPVPAFGKAPNNYAQWNVGVPLTYSEDADAKYLKDRGLPVAFYVPAQSKVVQVPNPAYKQLQNEIAALQQQLAAATKPEEKLALGIQIAAKQLQLAGTPQTVAQTLTAPQIGTPDAYQKNRDAIAKYKAELKDGSADNAVIDAATANSADLNGLADELTENGVKKPTKFNQIDNAVADVNVAVAGIADAAAAARADLLKLLDQAGVAVDFLNNLAEELTKSGHRGVDKLQRKLAAASAPGTADLDALDPHARALVQDALAQLAGAAPPGNAQATLAALPPDRQREALQQISSFQRSLEALQGDAAPPTSSPSFQASSRLVRV